MPRVPRVTFQALTLSREATSIKANVSVQPAALPAGPEELGRATGPPSAHPERRGQSDTAPITARKAGRPGTQPCSHKSWFIQMICVPQGPRACPEAPGSG